MAVTHSNIRHLAVKRFVARSISLAAKPIYNWRVYDSMNIVSISHEGRRLQDSLIGCILGTAVGDAVGLVCEGLTPVRQRRLYGVIDAPQLIGRRGMISDDTEHICLAAEALIASAGDVELFERQLARGLRGWFLAGPAGIGWATLRSCMLLCVGVSPARSGVYSAGNGPAMRSAIFGTAYGSDLGRLVELVRACTRITHTDPKAEAGALAVAVAAAVAALQLPYAEIADIYRERWAQAIALTHPDVRSAAAELTTLLERAIGCVQKGQGTADFVASIDTSHTRGISGYIYRTVPAAIHAWLSHPGNARAAVLEIVHCGGDTDTTGAITGAIVGAGVGRAGIPDDWIASLWEWPHSAEWMAELGEQLSDVVKRGLPQQPPAVPFAACLIRNAIFAVVVIAQALRHFLPPY